MKLTLRLPAAGPRPDSTAIEPAADTRLGRALAAAVTSHPGKSGIYALAAGEDAFAARALLAETADRTIDVQYYIWHHDTSGSLLFDALRRAADRGVRVRLLLDDINTAGLDHILAELDQHPNIEVRLFNPFRRPARFLGYLLEFARVNRRMHNKSFTVDNQATIVGGRNIGDEYFGAAEDRTFFDLDVLAVGPAVQEVSRQFDHYWASESSYPAKQLLRGVDPASMARSHPPAAETPPSPAASRYLRAVAERTFVRDLIGQTLNLEWAVARMLSDDPAKVLGQERKESLVWPQMKAALGPPRNSLGLLSAYFVPGRAGTEGIANLARQGVKVRIVTNSLEATDVALVHAGYAKHRRALLAAGVELFEIKRAFVESPGKTGGFFGSSSSSLHAKTFSVDHERVFVGSFNFDPRSWLLNTEMGLVIESPALANAIANALARETPARAYRVRLTDRKELQWVELVDGREVIHTTEPGTGAGRRALVWLLSWLPIDWLL